MGIFEYELRKRSSSKKVCEDELTSRVFGFLEIISKDILLNWLKIDGISQIEYWPQFKECEPEILLYDSYGNAIIIEDKYDDKGSVGQLIREYRLALEHNKGRLIFITSHISKPIIVEKAERELHLKESTIEWTNWYKLYTILKNEIESLNTASIEKKLMKQLMKFLEWRKMELEFGDMMKNYIELYEGNKWLVILSEKFHDFMLELRKDFENTIKSHYGHYKISGRFKDDLLSECWINIHSDKIEKINDRLYYCVLFDMENFSWNIHIEGKNMEIKRKIGNYLKLNKTDKIELSDITPDSDGIAYRIIQKKPDFNNPTILKKEIIKCSIEFIENMDNILQSGKEKHDL